MRTSYYERLSNVEIAFSYRYRTANKGVCDYFVTWCFDPLFIPLESKIGNLQELEITGVIFKHEVDLFLCREVLKNAVFMQHVLTDFSQTFKNGILHTSLGSHCF